MSSMEPRTLGPRGRSALTLVLLFVVFVAGVGWAWSAVTEPFPEAEEAAACIDTELVAGDSVSPGQVLVSVLNASDRDGLAGDTLDALARQGFGIGDTGNAPALEGTPAQIWVADPDSPAARLVASYLGRKVQIIDQEASTPGITVVVGDDFPGVSKGRRAIELEADTVVCTPPPPAA